MDRVENKETGLDRKLHMIKDHAENSLTMLHSHEDEMQGGSYDEVLRMIKDEEESSRDEADDDRLNHAKSLDEFLDNSDPPEIKQRYGNLPLEQSSQREYGQWTCLSELPNKSIGDVVSFRGRVHIVRRMSPVLLFIVFRQQLTTVQGVLRLQEGEISKAMIRWVGHIRSGSIVIARGKLQYAEQHVTGTTFHDREILLDRLNLLTERTFSIPFSVYEAEAATDGHTIADRVRLSNRILDLRSPTSQAIFRVQSGICNLFRNFLSQRGFLEIHTPKLQGGATEGGSDVFKVDYFGRPAFLAQSPQLAKQMCISADFGRVFEIGPVFRAENSNTPRHMTEYTGVDLEMVIDWHYHEAMQLIDQMLKYVFHGIYDKFRKEIDTLKHHFPHKDLVWLEDTVIIRFSDGVKMLNDSGWRNDDGSQQSEHKDLPTKGERRLGELVKEKYHTDYYILDKFPTSARPFYTMLDPDDENVTNSFDFMVRGQEILSGGQRIHEIELLNKRLAEAKINPTSLREYLQGFEWVAPPHAGAGVGLERLVSLVLQLGNIRYATLFPRDPKSFPAQPSTKLRYPDDDTLNRRKGHLQPLGNLIANYGDSTNTSWFDKRFQVWRDTNTGAAVAWVPIHRRAILPGNPLCADQQLEEVVTRFLQWLKKETKLKPIFVLVDKSIESIMGDTFGWKSFSNVAEQRVNLGNREHLDIGTEVNKKIRHAQKEGIAITKYGDEIPIEVKNRCDKAIAAWKKSRTGQQVHLSEVTPWEDSEHRQYFVAEDKSKSVHAMVVLAQLAPKHGVQIKWALDFPNGTNGAIEYAIESALKEAAKEHKSCTFGAGATSDLASGENMGMTKATILNSVYQVYAERFGVDKKSGFRAKFNTSDEPLYICYPSRAMRYNGLRAIIDFFKD